MPDSAPNSAIPSGFEPFPIDGEFNDLLGTFYVRDDPPARVWGFVADSRYSNPNGVVHGGMLMTFADTAMGQLAEDTSGMLTATISLNVEFVAATPVENQWVECRPAVVRMGRSVAFMRGEVSAGGTVLLVAQGVWRIFDKPSHRVKR